MASASALFDGTTWSGSSRGQNIVVEFEEIDDTTIEMTATPRFLFGCLCSALATTIELEKETDVVWIGHNDAPTGER